MLCMYGNLSFFLFFSLLILSCIVLYYCARNTPPFAIGLIDIVVVIGVILCMYLGMYVCT